jgi:hypothetical protein
MIDKSMINGLCVPTTHIFTASILERFWPHALSSINTIIEGGSGEKDIFSSSRMEMHDNSDTLRPNPMSQLATEFC